MSEQKDNAGRSASGSGDGRPFLLVGNPASRQGRGAESIELAGELMSQRGLAHELRPTVPEGGTAAMVAAAIADEGFETVVCLGGDGTFNQVAKGVCLSGASERVRIGLLPAGTANDQGKSFGLSAKPRELERNVEVLAEGHETRLDVGEVEARADNGTVLRRDLFFDSLGWGLSAAILQFRNRELDVVKNIPVWREMYRDHMVYIRAAMHELALNWVTRDHFTAEIEIDGEVHVLGDLTDIVVSNTLLYGGEWMIDPEARHDDGKLEIAPFCGTRDWTSKLIVSHKRVPLTEEMLNRIGVSHSSILKGSSIKVQILRPNVDKRLPSQIDGEEFVEADNFEISVHERLLRLIVPREFHWI
ncbi:MAG: diacylglycerol kinase family protein [Polyangia bacterium]